VTGCLILN